MGFMKRRTYLALFLTLMLIEGIVVFNATIFSNSANAEVFEAEQGLSFTLKSSVAVSITGGTGSGSDGLTIEDLVPGDYKDSNIITVTASSNNVSGYTLSSSVGSSTYASTELRRNATETANKFTSLTENKDSLSKFDPGYWGYSYSTNGGTSWISGDIVSGTSSGYNGLPLYTTTTPIKLINSSSASSSSIQFKIGAKATSSQVSGAYTNIINFIGVGKVITTNYAITFNDPSGEASGMPSQQTGTTDSGAVQLPSTVPTRTNYIFKGWCTINNSSDPTTCTGTNAEIIQPGNFLPLNTSSASITKTLYAVWKDNTPKLYMQDATLADCGKTMYDKRDLGTETAYTTAMIGDTCWMTTNLNLAGGTALSADDTDVTSAYISSFTTSNNLTKSGNTIVLPASTTDSGFEEDNYSYVANSGNASSGCSSAPGCYSYYSWDAATLGSGRTIATDNTNAEQSICPKGWHLPTTYNGSPNDSTDFRKLMIALGGSAEVQTYNSRSTPTGATMSSALQASPNNFLLAGLYYDGSFLSGGSYGRYWSSTSTSDNSSARHLYFSSSNVNSASSNYRCMGYSVRCVLGS